MFDNYEMTFIRVEGLGDVSSCSCNFFIDDRLHDSQQVSDLESSQHILTVPSKGELKIRIEDQSLIASLQFSLSIIKCQGYHWLPLFTGEHDTIEEVPEEVGLPRVLLIFQSRKCLSPVIEITETSEVSETVETPEFGEDVKGIELRMKIIELEQALQFEKLSQVQSIEKITKDFKTALDKTSFELEKFKIWSEKYKEKCIVMEKQLVERNREIEDRKKENEEVMKRNSELQEQYRLMMRSQEEVFNQLELREQEILSLKSATKTPATLIITQADQIQLLPIKLAKSKAKLLNSSDTSATTSQSLPDLLDYYLQSSLKDLKLEGFFQKTTETFYKVGSKRVGVVLKNKSIYCKQGESFKTLESYIFSHLTTELETFIKKRAISRPQHKRFKSFSGVLNEAKLSECKTVKLETSTMNSSVNYKNKSMTPSKARLLSNKANS